MRHRSVADFIYSKGSDVVGLVTNLERLELVAREQVTYELINAEKQTDCRSFLFFFSFLFLFLFLFFLYNPLFAQTLANRSLKFNYVDVVDRWFTIFIIN